MRISKKKFITLINQFGFIRFSAKYFFLSVVYVLGYKQSCRQMIFGKKDSGQKDDMYLHRIGVIGSGPAGFYTAEHLLQQKDLSVAIDMFERLPTPFGLVRSGVAPDHQRTKRAAEYYHQIARNPNFRFFGNVEFGRDIQRDDLLKHYHQVVYASGAPEERRLDIPGEDLTGVYSARDLVGWYNAHPDFSERRFDFSHPTAVIIGNGNVALDIARMLLMPEELLEKTDVAGHAIEPLLKKSIREIHILGRKDLMRAPFSVSAVERLLQLPDVSVECPPESHCDTRPDESVRLTDDRKKRISLFHYLRDSKTRKGNKKIVFHFLVTPSAVTGKRQVESVRLRHHRILHNEIDPSFEFTGRESELKAGIVIRSIGYRGSALPGVPFDTDQGIIPNTNGRIHSSHNGSYMAGEYTSGWIKRGPSGSLPHIRIDARETALSMIEDIRSGTINQPVTGSNRPTADWLFPLKNDFTLYEDWLQIDAIEKKRGAESKRPRVKFTNINDMLNILTD